MKRTTGTLSRRGAIRSAALFAALLLPALSNAKESARATQCLNQMRQLGAGVLLFAENNSQADHLMPEFWYPQADAVDLASTRHKGRANYTFADTITFRLTVTADTHWIDRVRKIGPATNGMIDGTSHLAVSRIAELKPGDLLPDYELIAENGKPINPAIHADVLAVDPVRLAGGLTGRPARSGSPFWRRDAAKTRRRGRLRHFVTHPGERFAAPHLSFQRTPAWALSRKCVF